METLSEFRKFMHDGGLLMWIILAVFVSGLAIGVYRFFRLRTFDINASSFMNEIQKLILANKIKEAIQYCSGTTSVMARVMKNGLKRSNQNLEQVQNAIDATALEVVPQVSAGLNWLGYFGGVATLFGLLGTILGLIESFKAVALADPAKKAEVLSNGIAIAMNSTAFGLLTAILITFLHTFIAARSEKILNDIDQYGVKLLDLLGTMKANKGGTLTNDDL